MAKKRTLNTFRGKFICGDCEDILKTMPDSSIDLVLTSPPYADKRDYGDVDGTIPPDEYVDWFIPKAKEIYRVLKEDGSFILNISDKVVGNYQHLYVFELLLKLYLVQSGNSPQCLLKRWLWENEKITRVLLLVGKRRFLGIQYGPYKEALQQRYAEVSPRKRQRGQKPKYPSKYA